jgi:hypothetical protein
MALAATIVWEVRPSGSDTNGGGFKAGASGTDWTQQDAAQYAVTDAVTNGTTTITSATANFGTDVVGNLLYIVGGTGSITEDWYEITSRTNSTTIIVDRSTGLTSGTGATLNIGGGLASPALPFGKFVAGQDVWIKQGTYTITVNTANVAGGKINSNVGGLNSANTTFIRGYNATRGDGGRPTISAGAETSLTIFNVGAGYQVISDIIVDGENGTGVSGFVMGSSAVRSRIRRIHATKCTASGVNYSTAEGHMFQCTATGCTAGNAIIVANNAHAVACEAYDNSANGFLLSGTTGRVTQCISSGNSGATSDGFTVTGRSSELTGCVAYGNGRDGFRVTADGATMLLSCLAEGNTAGTGFNVTAAAQGNLMVNCGYYNNSTNVSGNMERNEGGVLGTATFFTNAGAADFSLNNTAGGGAAVRATGYPGAMPRGTTTGYRDIGVAQHADPVGGGGGDLFGGGLVH